MASESLNWRPLTYESLKGLNGVMILVVKSDNKGYYGSINQLTPDFVMLANGDHRQVVTFLGTPAQFAIIHGPERRSYGLAAPQLPLS